MERAGTVDQGQETVSGEVKGTDLFDLLIVLLEDRKRIVLFTLIAAIVGATISFLVKPTFSATALILPPEQGQSLSSMMGQLGSLAALSGNSIKTPADMYVGILGSRTIADHIIARFHLQDLYKTRKLEDTRVRLKSNSLVLATKDGLIHVTVDDHDPNRASELANAFVDELYAMNSRLAVTEAAQRRIFFDQELADEKNALTTAENDLKQAEEKTGVIQLSGQAESIIRSLAQVRAEISSREVQLQSMRTFATDQNPEAVRLQEEINTLRAQLAQLEKDPRNSQSSNGEIASGQVPQVGLEYARKLRDVRYHESLYELLSKQYEAARIDEAKAAPVIQVIDRAVPPDKKSGPHRTLVTLGFAVIGFFLACLQSVVARFFRRLKQVPEYALKLTRLRNGLRFSR